MAFNTNQANYKKLVTLLHEGKQRVIPYVGAGLSIYGKPEQRLPQWHDLLKLLEQRAIELGLISKEEKIAIEQLMKEKKLISAADIIVNALGENQFRLIMEEKFDIKKHPVPPAILDLVCISWSLIVTTNLDRFIETAWASKHKAPLQVITSKEPTNLAEAVLGHNSQPTLLKTHGTIERYNTWILTEAHYNFLLSNNYGYVHALKILYGQTLLFIGFGLTDGDFELLLEQLKELYPAGVGNNFALISESAKGTDWMNRLIREYGLQPIWYNVDSTKLEEEDCGHGEVVECLQSLVHAWVTGQQGIPISLKSFPELEPCFVGRKKELAELSKMVFEEGCQSIQITGFGGEGKTSLIQRWLEQNVEKLGLSHFNQVFGCSFYEADVGRFIEYAYAQFSSDTKPLDIASKAKKLERILHDNPNLIILDGLEAVQREDGEITNLFLRDIIDAASQGQSTIIVSSRLPLDCNFKTIDIEHLDENDAIEIFRQWDVPGSNEELRCAIRNYVGCHALSIRIIASFIKAEGITNLSFLEGLHPTEDVRDESNPVEFNKAARVLHFYQRFLTTEDLAFMKTFSLFRRPVSETVIQALFPENLGISSVNSPLKGVDIVPILAKLKNRRLLLQEREIEITCHPLVRDYFLNQTSPEEASPIHKRLTEHYMEINGSKQPMTLEDAYLLFEVCYHSAKAGEWKIFHHVFNDVINNGISMYLGYIMGAWEEFLSLARLAFPDENLSNEPAYLRGFYFGAVALSLKRLGRSEEAIPFYFSSIKSYAMENPREAARQVNNLFILNTSIGNFQLSAHLARLNVGSIEWIPDRWQKLWQIEAMYTTFGKVSAHLGNMSQAKEYFEEAFLIRGKKGYRTDSLYDLQRISYVDLLLVLEDFEKAEEICQDIAKTTKRGKWKDAISSSLRAYSSLCRAKARKSSDAMKLLEEAKKTICASLQVSRELFQPELEIEIRLEEMRIAIDRHVAGFGSEEELFAKAGKIGNRLKLLLKRTGLHFYEPEVLAVLGRLELLKGNVEDAHALAVRAKSVAINNGDTLVLTSEWLDLSPLLSELRISNDVKKEVPFIYFPSLNWIDEVKISKEEFLVEIEEMQKSWVFSSD